MSHEPARVGDGMTPAVHSALVTVVKSITPSMFKAQEPWALMGSSASVLQGIDGYSPPDIDLVTTAQGAYMMSGAVGACGGATIRQVKYSEAGPYASHFGIFEVEGVKVEVMGDLVIRVDDGVINAGDHFARWSDKVRILHFDGLHVPVIPLEWQLVANAMLRRPERTERIRRFFLDHGFDAAYLRELLMDEQLGERTIRAVHEAVKLDA
jgi:hypothetical protein